MDPEPLTLSDIDTSRALRTDDELLQLVAAIHGSRPEAQETNWLEWKSSLDLTKAPGKFAVAKAVLGFANRSVDDARLTTGGVAYMVVGVEPGAAAGVAAIDHANLTPGIKTYASTPRFTPRTLRYAGVEVLVVMVEPPEPGDLVHSLQKQYDKFDAGVVFHRGPARTAPAGPKEIEMLVERRVQGALQPQLDLTLRAEAKPLTRFTASVEELDEWLSRHEKHVRANGGRPPEPPPPTPEPRSPMDITRSAGMDAMRLFGRYVNPKDAEEFDRRVQSYLTAMRRRLLDHIVKDIVEDDDTNTVHFAVGNETDHPVSGVQITVRVPRDGLLVYTTPPSVNDLPDLPKWPDPMDQWLPNIPGAMLRSAHPYALHLHSASVEDTPDAFEVTWDIGDLRPGEWSRDLTITVVAGPNAPDPLSVDLVARAMDRSGTRRLTEPLTVSPEAWTVDDFYVAEPS